MFHRSPKNQALTLTQFHDPKDTIFYAGHQLWKSKCSGGISGYLEKIKERLKIAADSIFCFQMHISLPNFDLFERKMMNNAADIKL